MPEEEEPYPPPPVRSREREPRYKILAGMSYVCVSTGIWYATRQAAPSAGADMASRLVPLWLLSAVWLAIGVFGLAAVILRRPGYVVFALQFGMFLLWAGSFWAALIIDHSVAAYVVASWFTGFAVTVAYATRVEPPLWITPHWWAGVWARALARLPWR